MEKFIIHGGKKLHGEITVSGAKNAAVAILPATLLVKGKCIIENVPNIQDVNMISDILVQLGASVKYIDDCVMEIDTSRVKNYKAPYEMAMKLRASYYLLGALLGRFKNAELALPGGCDFGVRPMDQHIKGFEALGANVDIEHGCVIASASKLIANQIYLDVVSVGATINIMLTAVLAEGTTIIENAAKEPHIVDVANFLNSMGADIKGAGTDVIKVNGVDVLKGGSYSIIPDQIEAGTFMIAAAATGGDVLIKNVIPKHMESITAKLIEMNVEVIEYDEDIRVRRNKKLSNANIKTLPYPGFPTDLQPIVTCLLSIAEGTSIITENVWESRFQYVDELKRLGANIKVEGRTAIVEGVESLSGAPVKATDLRAGAAMVVAGLISEGVTEIRNIYHIDRGYEKIEEKLSKLGAKIERCDSDKLYVCEDKKQIS